MSYSFKVIEGQAAYESSLAFLLFEIDRQFFPTPWDQGSWTNLFHEHDRLLVVINDSDIVIGFALFDRVIADSFAHLLKIVIHPTLRGQGLAKELLSKALLVLEASGCSHFFLEVEETNKSAQKLYLSAGFNVIHRKKNFYGENRAALIMTR